MNKSSEKERNLNHLNSQIIQLSSNLQDLNELVNITTNQYKIIEKLGIVHSSIFIASQKVFSNESEE
ncbi:hypothetical protein CLIB1444_03S03158 [[Candida] jaroonii]|uniref:Uncharacterized protein n=1 Tax=[Candida] jaroonii TaxID=467808 RepID=A0ACA9Y544_9ASCO|nr:hypothetical protein CLIB1444_03S03158 [[Candida] jaroonii]